MTLIEASNKMSTSPPPRATSDPSTRQAPLPLSTTSMKMGSDDGGRTVLNSCPRLDNLTASAAKKLGLRAHIVGGRLRHEKTRDSSGEIRCRKKNVDGQRLHAAADVEGHEGTDSRYGCRRGRAASWACWLAGMDGRIDRRSTAVDGLVD